mmetsp:Transcript_35392/g.111092  ORF Transcript_35392/g.111092 Transcript_35392/m.111092 type:complete len:250 (-) Transcript_35392:72-821(-)
MVHKGVAARDATLRRRDLRPRDGRDAAGDDLSVHGPARAAADAAPRPERLRGGGGGRSGLCVRAPADADGGRDEGWHPRRARRDGGGEGLRRRGARGVEDCDWQRHQVARRRARRLRAHPKDADAVWLPGAAAHLYAHLACHLPARHRQPVPVGEHRRLRRRLLHHAQGGQHRNRDRAPLWHRQARPAARGHLHHHREEPARDPPPRRVARASSRRAAGVQPPLLPDRQATLGRDTTKESERRRLSWRR